MVNPIARWRRIKDGIGAALAAFCGIGIIASLLLIFGYLAWEAAVLAQRPSLAPLPQLMQEEAPLAPASSQVWLNLRGGKVLEVSGADVSLLSSQVAPVPQDWHELQDFAPQLLLRDGFGDQVALGLNAQGEALLFHPSFELSWAEGTRDYHQADVRPEVAYLLGGRRLNTGLATLPERADFLFGEEELLLLTASGRELSLVHWRFRPSVIDDALRVDSRLVARTQLMFPPVQVLMGADGLVYALSQEGQLQLFQLHDTQLHLLETRQLLVEEGQTLSAASLLLGRRSLVVGDNTGGLALWRYVRHRDADFAMYKIRSYEGMPAAVVTLLPEPQRKGFYALDAQGYLHSYYIGERASQQSQQLPSVFTGDSPPAAWLDINGQHLLMQSGNTRAHWLARNEYADVSTSLLWAPVWYEDYEEGEWLWQSSAADLDFEPKFSLMPLVLGTLKGALYAMLFAVPVALLSAVYVACFMAPSARAIAKPGIETLAALPTVILGFLAALWLAPLVADYLSGILLAMAALPLGLMLFALGWRHFPQRFKHTLSGGWEFVAAIPVALLILVLFPALSPFLDGWLFDGDFIFWIEENLSITYEQRNAVIVGMAMSIAVIPTIFSIAEDALFAAPKSLMDGALALGATPWQAVVRVIIPTASPGLLSALMIGLGRAVGETMVVVMATGNTPVMDWMPFTGMRTLSANIAVEMPEAAIGSSHFQLLFLSAVLLFCMTFIANTVAEYVRARLRQRYATL